MHIITKSKVLVLHLHMTKTQHCLVSFMYDAYNNQKQSIGTTSTHDKNTALFSVIHV